MVDKDMVQTKLESLMRYVRRVEVKRPVSVEILANDLDLQDIIVVNIERAVRLSRSVGFRNIAVHAYEKINWSIVFAIATDHMNDFREFTGFLGSALDETKT